MTSIKQEEKEMVNTKQAAALLGVSTKTIYRMEKKGLLHSIKTPGGQRRFAKSDIILYLNKSRLFTAPQNPSKFLVREYSNAYSLFKETELNQELPIDQRIQRLEQLISLNTSYNHHLYYEKEASYKQWIEEWDFKNYNTKIYTHGFHSYPAMFIPQVARKLILTFSKEGDLVCDIFCGSGTTLVESSLLNRNSIGIELNPLAVLIARAKTTPIDPKTLTNKLKTIIYNYQNIKSVKLPTFKNIEFWFSNEAIKELARLREAIWNISEENIRNFFSVCFSEVVRIASFAKHEEFKLLRSPDKIANNNKVNIIEEFIKKCENNIMGMKEYVNNVSPYTHSRIIMGDATKDNGIPNNSVDFIITSPPYGDSRTTVAYGQFSRLSSQWLDLLPLNIKDIDKELIGGKSNVEFNDEILKQSDTLKFSIDAIRRKDENRAREVLSFYIDLNKALIQAYNILKPQKYFCLIVGNRTVKELVLKTDMIICELGENIGFTKQAILYRNIPNKRMPSKNSPTNKIGKTGTTIMKESIILLKKS